MGLRKQAIENSEKFYFTGKSCKNGHIAKRISANGGCVECLPGIQRRADQKKERKEYKKLRARENRSANRVYVKQSQSRKPEKYAALYAAHCAKRRAAKLQRTPVWSDLEKIKEIYDEAQSMAGEFHVDHIIPLCGNLVSGLHVFENLQIIPASENVKKWKHFSV